MSGQRVPPKGTAPARVGDKKAGRTADKVERKENLIRDFVWGLVSLNMHFEEIRYAWAEVLGVSGPQWLILMAVNDLDRGNGVTVKDTATRLHVDRSFITTQTQNLEKQGFLKRTVSSADARVVLMSITDKTRKEIKSLSGRQQAFNEFIFSDLDEVALRDIIDKFGLLTTRLEKASSRISADS